MTGAHTPFARRQSELDHFLQVLTSGRAKRAPGSVDCEGLGVTDGLSGREREKKQHEGASDEAVLAIGLAGPPKSPVLVSSRDDRVRPL